MNLDNNAFCDIHKNGRGVLIGNGPTISESCHVVKQLQLDGYLLFGNNESIFSQEMFGFDLDYHFICDTYVMCQKKFLPRYIDYCPRKIKFFYPFYETEEKIIADVLGCSVDNFYEHIGSCKLWGKHGDTVVNFVRADGFVNNAWEYAKFTSISLTAQMMLFMGIKEILIAGLDCSGNENAFRQGGALHKRGYSHNVYCWKNFAEYVSKYWSDVKVKSINPVGLKGVFEEYEFDH